MAKRPGRPRGSRNKFTKSLKDMILGALRAKDGQKYLERVADKDPKTFCALLGRVLPLTIAGDPANPIKYEVVLSFGPGENDVSAHIQGAAIDGKALEYRGSASPGRENGRLRAETVPGGAGDEIA